MKQLVQAAAVIFSMVLLAGNSYAIDLTIVSWGGAYAASQKKAYNDPYMAENPEVRIVNDDSGAEGLSKVRAQVESGSVTWGPGRHGGLRCDHRV